MLCPLRWSVWTHLGFCCFAVLQDEVLHLEGWLLKEDPTRRMFRRRYFVLHHNRLWYYQLTSTNTFQLSTLGGIHNIVTEPSLT